MAKGRSVANNRGYNINALNDRTFGWLLIVVGLFLALNDLDILRLGLNLWTIIFLVFGLYFLSKSRN